MILETGMLLSVVVGLIIFMASSARDFNIISAFGMILSIVGCCYFVISEYF